MKGIKLFGNVLKNIRLLEIFFFKLVKIKQLGIVN